MKKIIIITILMLIFAIPSYGMLQFQDCVTTDPYFQVELDPININRSIQSIPNLEVNLETMVTITPDSEVSIRRIDFGVLPTQNMDIKNIVDQQVLDNNYVIHITAEFDDNAGKSSAVGSTIRVNGIVARVMFQDVSGNLERTNLCVPDFNLRITGNSSSLPDEVEERIEQIENKIDAAEKIQLLIAALNLMATFSCDEKEGELNMKLSSFNSNCLQITDELKNIKLETPGYSVANNCTSTDTADKLHPDNCNSCLNLYDEITQLTPIVKDSCERLDCNNMISFEHFKSTYGGDILGINYCSADNYNETKCKEQYVASENPKCLFGDPLELSKAAETPATGINILGIIDNNFCSDRRNPITIIKSPSNDLFSSLTCGCLPALVGWADLWHDSLMMELDCVKAAPSNNRNLSTCRNALFTFSCDMAINALTCGGLNFGVHSESAKFLFNSTGGSVNIEGATPQQIREHINNGYTTMISGSASFDTSELIHSMCASVFGDADIDWSEVALNSFERSEVQVVSLCPSGPVKGPCYCGSDLTDISTITNNCGLVPNKAYCDFDSSPTGECTASVTIPVPNVDISYNPPVPELPEDEPVKPTNPKSGIPPSDYKSIPDKSNSDYRPYRTDEEFYYKMPSNQAVNVYDCAITSNGVKIRVSETLSRSAVLTLFHPGFDSSTNSVHKFHCFENGDIVSRGEKVIRIEYDKSSGSKLPPNEQSVPEVTDTRATSAQIERMATSYFYRIKQDCEFWSTMSESNWQIVVRPMNNRVQLRIKSLANCIANYPSCTTYDTSESYEDEAKSYLTLSAKNNLGIDEYNRLISLPVIGSSEFAELSQIDKSMSICIRWISP